MKRTLQGILLAAAFMLATCSIPAMADGPGPPPKWPPKAHVSTPVAAPTFVSTIHLL
jgi:hypothetical protein